MVVRYPALPTQLAPTSSASHSARRSPAPLLRGFRDGLVGWRCVLSPPEAGVVVYWQPKR